MSDSDAPMPWYRIPIVWIVIGIPAFSIVFTLCIVWISVKTFDGVVVDDYYRKGLEINRELARDRHAVGIGLQGHARIEDGRLSVQLESDVGTPWPEQLVLGFYHPGISNRDVIVNLQHVGFGSYEAARVEIGNGKWNVSTGTDAWRLEGKLFHPNEAGFRLRPFDTGVAGE